MYTKQPKKMLIINILDILKKYSDEEHRLSQKDIIEILARDYDMQAERKAIKRNIMNLIDFGYEIEYTENVRTVVNPKTGEQEESSVLSDFYLVRDFDDSELRLLIDGLLFSKHVPYSQCKTLVEKLEGLSSNYFRARVKHISTLSDNAPPNKQLFYTIDVLDDAISKHKQVSLRYNHFGTDKKLHPNVKDGKIIEYVINPYQIAATNGRYYLICNFDQYDNVSHLRLDRITEIKLLDTPVKSMKKVTGLENGFDLPRHMAEHVYMYAGESIPVTFTAKKYIVSDVIDWFGKDVKFTGETEDEVTVKVIVNREAMRKWAMQYALHVTVVEPVDLRDDVKRDLEEAVDNYR